jgi:hypothetical protein
MDKPTINDINSQPKTILPTESKLDSRNWLKYPKPEPAQKVKIIVTLLVTTQTYFFRSNDEITTAPADNKAQRNRINKPN